MEDYKKTRYTLQGTTPPPPPHAHTHLYRKRDRLAQADRHHVRENGKAEAPRKEKYANTHIHNTCSRVELQPLHVLARTKRDLHTHILLHSPLFAPGGKSDYNTFTTHVTESNFSRYICWLTQRDFLTQHPLLQCF